MILDGPCIRLRPWREADADAFAALNADPEVMRHFTSPLTRAESDAFLAHIMRHQAEHGFSFWALERRGAASPIGLCGLSHVSFQAPFAPAVEIGWRLMRAHWRRGLAEEAARLALAAGFGPLRLPEIVAFTVPANEPSWRLMEKLGMRAGGRFAHPRLPEGNPLRTHLLYRLSRAEWVAQRIG